MILPHKIKRQRIFVALGCITVIVVMAIVMEILLRFTGKYASYHERNGLPYVSIYENNSHEGHLYRYSSRLYGQASNSLFKEFTHTRFVNELGFIEEKREEISGCNHLRILALGDSFTDGIGAKFEESWPKKLEKLLQSQQPDCFVYNAGIPGSDPLYEYKAAEFLMPALKPEIVILAMTESDFWDISVRGDWKRFKENGTTEFTRSRPCWEPLYIRSHLVRFIMRFFLRYNGALIFEDENKMFKKNTPIIFETIDSLQTLCKKNNAVAVPVYLDIWREPQDVRFGKALQQRYENSIVISIAPSLLWPIDKHCNAAGYEYIAKQIHNEIQRML